MNDKPIFAKEASAEIRSMAANIAALFASLVNEGFSEQQALYLIGQMFRQGGSSEQPPGE